MQMERDAGTRRKPVLIRVELPRGRKLVIAAPITQGVEQEGGVLAAPIGYEGVVWPPNTSNAVRNP